MANELIAANDSYCGAPDVTNQRKKLLSFYPATRNVCSNGVFACQLPYKTGVINLLSN